MRPRLLATAFAVVLFTAGCASAPTQTGGNASEKTPTSPTVRNSTATGSWSFDNRTGHVTGTNPYPEGNPPTGEIHERFTVAPDTKSLLLVIAIKGYDSPLAIAYPPCSDATGQNCPFSKQGNFPGGNGTISSDNPTPGEWRVRFGSSGGIDKGPTYAYDYALSIQALR